MKILIADDSLVARRMLGCLLTEWGYEVTEAADGVEAWQILQRDDAPRLAILDWLMPGLDGDQVCQEVRKRSEERYTYILLVTVKADKDDVVQGLEAGADDYVVKPYDPLELKARLKAGKRILDLQDEMFAAHEALRRLATRDCLTGVLNRAAVLDRLERELARAHREHKPVSLFLADLDHFKRINDSYGHLAGDAVLREITQRMAGALRPYDMIGRYGGEEFLMLLPGCNEADALQVGERLRQRVTARPVHHLGKTIPVTVSLGVVVSNPSVPVNVQQLLHAADLALYRAKEAGRNRAEVGTASATPVLPAAAVPHRPPPVHPDAVLLGPSA